MELPLAVYGTFKLNALGLVTFLGAKSLDIALGSLASDHATEYLHLLAGHVIATGRISEPVPGFVMYNIDAAIKTTRISPWFARWLLAQDLTWSSTTLKIKVSAESMRSSGRKPYMILFGVLVPSLLLAASISIADWHALRASIALSIGTMSRISILNLYRTLLDTVALYGTTESDSKVRVLAELPDGKLVTIHTTERFLVTGLIAGPQPTSRVLHSILRAIAYLAFGLFIINLGSTSFPIQRLIIAAIAVSSISAMKKVRGHDNQIGKHISIKREDLRGVESCTRIYAALDLNKNDEEVMTKWHLFPQRSNSAWWKSYEKLCRES